MKKAASYLILTLGVVVVTFPFFWMISTSLKTSQETYTVPQTLLPKEPQWQNYPKAWQSVAGGAVTIAPADYRSRRLLFALALTAAALTILALFLRERPRSRRELNRSIPSLVAFATVALCAAWQWLCLVNAWLAPHPLKPQVVTFTTYFSNSLFVATCVTAGVLFTSILAAYAFANMNFRGRKPLFLLFLATMMIPFEVTIVPNFMTIDALGWYNSFAALIVPWLASVFSVFILRQFFRTIPPDYFNAARIDGCGHWRYLWAVAVPMAAPALVTITLFTFLASWNAFLWPMLVTDETRMRVVQYGLKIMMDDNSTNFHLLMAAAAIVIIPVVALYLVLQRRFIEGVSGAGLKG